MEVQVLSPHRPSVGRFVADEVVVGDTEKPVGPIQLEPVIPVGLIDRYLRFPTAGQFVRSSETPVKADGGPLLVTVLVHDLVFDISLEFHLVPETK